MELSSNSDDLKPDTNADRLLIHLKKDSLAARIVGAYAGVAAEDRKSAIEKIIHDRLAEVERVYNEDK